MPTWRCKCGLRVKAIGETPKNKPGATVTAQCPNCGDGQLIYANGSFRLRMKRTNPHRRQNAHSCCGKLESINVAAVYDRRQYSRLRIAGGHNLGCALPRLPH
jgi:hypothetical protein